PRLQQSVKLLQMSTLDFSREVAEAIANNPFLEEEDGHTDEAAAGEAPEGLNAIAPPLEHGITETSEIQTLEDSSSYESSVTEYDPSVEIPTSYSGDYPTARNSDQ